MSLPRPTPDAIVETVRRYIGTPFHHQARLPRVGIDCIGVLVCAATEMGFVCHDRTDYGRQPRRRELVEAIARSMDQIQPEDAGVGDALVFWIRRRDWPQHAGVITTAGTPAQMVHAWADGRQVIEAQLTPYWHQHLDSAWRFRWGG